MNTVPCKGCGRPIVYAATEHGPVVPLDARRHPIYALRNNGTLVRLGPGQLHPSVSFEADVEAVLVSHFVTCPRAGEFHKKENDR